MILSRLQSIKPILLTPAYFNHYQTLNLTPTATE